MADGPAPAALSVIVADDHDLVRMGLCQLLRSREPDALLLEAADGHGLEALLAERTPWSLLLVDLNMPGFAGEAGVLGILSRFPSLPVVVISGHEDAAVMARLLEAGVRGFLPKSVDGGQMLSAIELILAGGRFLPPDLLQPRQGAVHEEGAAAGLTPRQQDILRLLLEGLPNKVIAGRLGIAESTVKMHMTALLRFHGALSRAELISRLR